MRSQPSTTGDRRPLPVRAAREERSRIFPRQIFRSAAGHVGRGAFLSAALAGLIGCSQPMTGSGYLGTYLDMKPNRYLQAESHLPWLTLEDGTTLVIEPVHPYFRGSTRPPFFHRLADSFQAALTREIGETKLFASVAEAHGPATPSGADWVLEAVITDVDTGLSDSSLEPGGAFRGNRRIGIEGKISEGRTGRMLIKFKDERVGLPSRGFSLTSSDVEASLLRDLDDIARGVADTLRQIRSESRRVQEPAPGGEGEGAVP
jgi:hypothetical protein